MHTLFQSLLRRVTGTSTGETTGRLDRRATKRFRYLSDRALKENVEVVASRLDRRATKRMRYISDRALKENIQPVRAESSKA